MLCAQHGRVHEHKAHNTGKKEGEAKCPRRPSFKFYKAIVPIISRDRHQHQRYNHEESVIVKQTIFAKFFRVKLLFEKHSIACGKQIVEQHKGVAVQIEAEIIATNNKYIKSIRNASLITLRPRGLLQPS